MKSQVVSQQNGTDNESSLPKLVSTQSRLRQVAIINSRITLPNQL